MELEEINVKRNNMETAEEKLFILDLLKLNHSINIDDKKYYPEESVINIIKQVLSSQSRPLPEREKIIEITKIQAKQFNRMYLALKEISSYETPNQLRKLAGKEYGLEHTEALEMAYENMQNTAKYNVKGIKRLVFSEYESSQSQ